jgi:hypothetical protein
MHCTDRPARAPLGATTRLKGEIFASTCLLFATLGVDLAAGCGSEPTATPTPPPFATASSCAAVGWPTITPPLDGEPSSGLVYSDGHLYYGTFLPDDRLTSMNISDGSQTPLASGFTNHVWVEEDQILYTGGDLGTTLFGLPIAGGTPTVVLDAGAGRTNPGILGAAALTPTDLFWVEQSSVSRMDPVTVWRASRASGVATLMASFPYVKSSDDLPFEDLALSGDAVVLGGSFRAPTALPLDGSTARALASTGVPARVGWESGTVGAGVYWTHPRAGPQDNQWAVIQSPSDGGDAREIAAISPFYGAPYRVWPDGQGGWVMEGETRFDDQNSHTTVWLADATGKVTLVACAAAGGLSPQILQIRQPPAVTPDFVYLAAESFGGANITWQLLRIPR